MNKEIKKLIRKGLATKQILIIDSTLIIVKVNYIKYEIKAKEGNQKY